MCKARLYLFTIGLPGSKSPRNYFLNIGKYSSISIAGSSEIV